MSNSIALTYYNILNQNDLYKISKPFEKATNTYSYVVQFNNYNDETCTGKLLLSIHDHQITLITNDDDLYKFLESEMLYKNNNNLYMLYKRGKPLKGKYLKCNMITLKTLKLEPVKTLLNDIAYIYDKLKHDLRKAVEHNNVNLYA